jgi:hypothetical protein
MLSSGLWCHVAHFFTACFSCYLLLTYLPRRFLLPWWWRQYIPTKHRFLQEPHGVHPIRHHSSSFIQDSYSRFNMCPLSNVSFTSIISVHSEVFLVKSCFQLLEEIEGTVIWPMWLTIKFYLLKKYGWEEIPANLFPSNIKAETQ